MKEQVVQKEFAIVFKTMDGVLSFSTFLTNNDAEKVSSDLISQGATLISAMTIDEAKDYVMKNLEMSPSSLDSFNH